MPNTIEMNGPWDASVSIVVEFNGRKFYGRWDTDYGYNSFYDDETGKDIDVVLSEEEYDQFYDWIGNKPSPKFVFRLLRYIVFSV